MAANVLIQTDIDGAVKDEAAAVLASLGLTVSDAVRLMLTRVAREHALPFDPLLPSGPTPNWGFDMPGAELTPRFSWLRGGLGWSCLGPGR